MTREEFHRLRLETLRDLQRAAHEEGDDEAADYYAEEARQLEMSLRLEAASSQASPS